MRLTIYLSDGGELDIADFDAATALDLRDGLVEPFLTFDMDGSTVLVNRDHIVRIDFDDVVTPPGATS